MRTVRKQLSQILSFALLSASSTVLAQSNEELVKATQNPVSDLISLPFQNNINTGIGPDDQTQNVLNIQPVWPVTLNEDWNIITRTILPVISQPDVLTNEGRVNGIGDLNFTAFFSPSKPGKMIWGVGPALVLPTASNDKLGSQKWSAGLAAVFLTMPGNWVVGSLFSNIWSVGGSGDQDVNLFTWQYFINYNLPKSWYLTSAPIITANWEADNNNQWTVPFGGGIGKIFKIGKQPINMQASAYKNIEKPAFGAEWQIRLQMQFLFPK